jgi:hypothetical protein
MLRYRRRRRKISSWTCTSSIVMRRNKLACIVILYGISTSVLIRRIAWKIVW